MINKAFFINDVGLSFLRWFIGLVFGVVFGFILAIIEYFIKQKKYLFSHLLNFLRAIPIIGLVPLIQILIGVKEIGKIGLIAWAVMFPMWITIKTTIEKNLKNNELVLKAAKVSNNKIRNIFLWPKIIGGMISGIEIGIGIAWLSVVAAEWVGTYSRGFWSGGLGYKLQITYNNNNWIGVNSILLMFGILGVCTSAFWKILIKKIFLINKGFDPVRWLKKG